MGNNIDVIIKLLPLIITITCTIIAVIFNCKGKAAIFVNGWDMLIFLLSAVAFAIGQDGSVDNAEIWMIAGGGGVIISLIWTIVFSIRCKFNFFLIICSLIAKIFFFFVVAVIFVLSIIKSFMDSRDHEYTERIDYSDGSSTTRTIYVPKSNVELEYLNEKWIDSVFPIIALFLCKVRMKR